MTDLAQREHIVGLIDQAVSEGANLTNACQVIGLSPSTVRRWRSGPDQALKADGRPTAPRPEPANKHTEDEFDRMLAVCNSTEFASLPPSQIVPTLADRGEYIGSESTLYRALRAAGLLSHRGRSQERQRSSKPTTHTSTAPNQVWMMDVTWLPSRVKGRFFYLYMIEDLFSRYGVHWEVFDTENGENTQQVIEQAMWREKTILEPPVLHNDNGSALKCQTVHQKVLSMGITPSNSRPRVSNDNAYIESMFRTLKYCPKWPSRGFETIEEARQWVQEFMQWYNHEHRHSAIKFVTPAQRHHGEDKAILARRDAFYRQQKQRRPDRWSQATRDWSYTDEVTLNPVNATSSSGL